MHLTNVVHDVHTWSCTFSKIGLDMRPMFPCWRTLSPPFKYTWINLISCSSGIWLNTHTFFHKLDEESVDWVLTWNLRQICLFTYLKLINFIIDRCSLFTTATMSQVNSTCCGLDTISPKLLTFVHATPSFCLFIVINLQICLQINNTALLKWLKCHSKGKSLQLHKIFTPK